MPVNAEDQRSQLALSGAALGNETVRKVIAQVVEPSGSGVFALDLHETVFRHVLPHVRRQRQIVDRRRVKAEYLVLDDHRQPAPSGAKPCLRCMSSGISSRLKASICHCGEP